MKILKIKSVYRYVRTSPVKIREVARVIVGSSALKSINALNLIPRKASLFLKKTLKSAIANAENNYNLKLNSLYVKNVLIDRGPVSKRFMPAARGQAKPYRRQTSHITIILSENI